MTHPVTRGAHGPRPPQGHGGSPPGGGRPGPARSSAPYDAPYDLVRLRAPEGPLRARTDPVGPDHGPGPVGGAQAGGSGGRRPRRGLRRFVSRHGWRTWAIPILTVVTFVCVMDITRDDPQAAGGSGSSREAESTRLPGPGARARTGIYVDSPSAGQLSGDLNSALPASALPPGGQYATQATGRFDVVPGWSRVYGSGGPPERFTVEVEVGVQVDRSEFAQAVERTLGNPHSWGGGGRMTFQRVDSGPVDFRISLASAMTVRRLCGYTLPFETSCYNGDLARAVINDARWVRGAVAYGADLAAYRVYVVNHEVGHALGHGHEPCPRAGALAPVMLQQTLGLDTPGVGRCRRNPWPYP